MQGSGGRAGHLSLVAAGEEEHSHAQDVIWRQFERVWRVSLRMPKFFAPSATACSCQTWDLQYLLSQPYILHVLDAHKQRSELQTWKFGISLSGMT